MSQTTDQCTVVNTRPSHQSTELSRKLWELNVSPIEFPTIEITEPDDWDPVDEAIEQLSQFDWLVFTSQNGVEMFIRRARSLDVEPSESIDQNIAAIGPSTTDRLREYGMTVELRPDEYRSESLAAVLLNEVQEDDRLLLPRSNISRPVLVNTLERHGIDVREIHPYFITKPSNHPSDTIERLKNDRVDLITFTSSMTVNHFDELIDEYNLEQLRDCPAACIGPITAETAKENGYSTPVVAEDYTTDGLIEAVKPYIRRYFDLS